MITTRLMIIGHTGRQTKGISKSALQFSRTLLSNYMKDQHSVFF